MCTLALSHFSKTHIFVWCSTCPQCSRWSFFLCFSLKIGQWIWYLMHKFFGPRVACNQSMWKVCRWLDIFYLMKRLVVHCSVGDSPCSRKAALESVSISELGLWGERLKELLRIRNCLLPFFAVCLWWKKKLAIGFLFFILEPLRLHCHFTAA